MGWMERWTGMDINGKDIVFLLATNTMDSVVANLAHNVASTSRHCTSRRRRSTIHGDFGKVEGGR